MPKQVSKALTDLSVRKARPAEKRYDLFDAALRGFGLRVSTSGAKTWFAMRRVNGRMVRHSLGRYPEYSLAEARIAAGAALKQMTEGDHPRADKAALFETVLEEWLARDQGKNRSVKDVSNAMTKHALPAFRGRPIDAIRKAHVLRLIDGIVDSGSPVQANRVLAYLRRLFNWCVERDLIVDNPAAGIKAPAREVSRERVLSIDELKDLLAAAERIGYPWGPLVEMLVYTGQRLDEVAQSTWDEVDLNSRVWALSGSRTKNGRPHVVHLSDLAIATILTLPQVEGQTWLFSTSGSGPVKGFSKAKARLDKESGVTGWTFHDLRRTFATFTTDKLDINPVVIDKVLNHASGAVKGIAAVYQRGEYLDQRKAAMEAWSNFLSSKQFQQPKPLAPAHHE
jgi:integrase